MANIEKYIPLSVGEIKAIRILKFNGQLLEKDAPKCKIDTKFFESIVERKLAYKDLGYYRLTSSGYETKTQ